MERYAQPVDKDDLHCSFCGKNKADVRKLIAGPAPDSSAGGRVFPVVAICDECVTLCADVCSSDCDFESELHQTLEWLGRAVIELLQTPPTEYDEVRQDLRAAVPRLLGTVREALMELEADQPYDQRNREISEVALEHKLRRAWELIGECRRVRARTRASRPQA